MAIEYWIVGWIICGILDYGLILAHFQRKFPSIAEECRNSDRLFAFGTALLGPIGLLSTVIFKVALKSHHGFMWRLPLK